MPGRAFSRPQADRPGPRVLWFSGLRVGGAGGGSLEAAVLRSHGSVVVETGRADVLAKQAVARKLGLVQFGADVHVR